MPILPIAMMDTDRMIPSTMHGNGSSPGSNQSGGQLSNGQLTNGLYNGQHHYQNASPTTPIGHPHPGKTSSLHIWMHCFIWTWMLKYQNMLSMYYRINPLVKFAKVMQ